jgi:hypothetical protein
MAIVRDERSACVVPHRLMVAHAATPAHRPVRVMRGAVVRSHPPVVAMDFLARMMMRARSVVAKIDPSVARRPLHGRERRGERLGLRRGRRLCLFGHRLLCRRNRLIRPGRLDRRRSLLGRTLLCGYRGSERPQGKDCANERERPHHILHLPGRLSRIRHGTHDRLSPSDGHGLWPRLQPTSGTDCR